MIEWRFCGRFSQNAQDAFPEDTGLSWIDEAEARRRYHDPAKELTLVPEVDATTGIVPWFITVTTKEFPSFTVTYQQPPGVPNFQVWWKDLGDGRLFSHRTDLWDYPAEHNPLVRLRQSDALMHFVTRNKEDGTGRLTIHEKGSTRVTTADRTFDPALLYAPVPEWGQWDQLASRPVAGQ
ncbi:hypothetical protein [Microbacterium natoriense]